MRLPATASCVFDSPDQSVQAGIATSTRCLNSTSPQPPETDGPPYRDQPTECPATLAEPAISLTRHRRRRTAPEASPWRRDARHPGRIRGDDRICLSKTFWDSKRTQLYNMPSRPASPGVAARRKPPNTRHGKVVPCRCRVRQAFLGTKSAIWYGSNARPVRSRKEKSRYCKAAAIFPKWSSPCPMEVWPPRVTAPPCGSASSSIARNPLPGRSWPRRNFSDMRTNPSRQWNRRPSSPFRRRSSGPGPASSPWRFS